MTLAHRPASDDDRKAARILAALAVAFALLPIAVATAGALRRGWIPIGDNALFQIRARDVFTRNHPLLGTWTSASHSLGVDVNNPGPLLFDLYALPAKINGTAGLAIGAAVVNALSVIGVAAFARRRGGAVMVTASMAMAAALAWTMGSELLFDPWQPHSLLFPFLFLLVLVWSMADGDLAAVPWAAGVASVIVQTHVSYAVLLPVLVLVGLAGLAAATLSARRRDGAEAWTVLRRRLRSAVLVTIAVTVACWAQPIVQQLAGPGRGNIGELASSVGEGDEPIGFELGTRVVGDVIGLAPFWARPSFATVGVLLERARVPAFGSAAVSLLVMLSVLVAVAVWGHRRRDGTLRSAAILGIVSIVGAMVTMSLLPLGEFGIATHQFRWLWPIGVFLAFAVAIPVLRSLPPPASAGLGVALTAGLAVAALPAYNIGISYGPAADADAIPTARALVRDLRGVEDQGPLLFDVRDLRFAEPYSAPVMAELQRRGIEFRVADESLAAQLGARRYIPRPVGPRLVQREGDAAYDVPANGRLVARVEGLTPTERGELKELASVIVEHIASDGLRLNADGRTAASLGILPMLAAQSPVAHDGLPLLDSGEFSLAVRQDLVIIVPAWRTRFERFAALQERRDRRTVAIFLVDGR